LPGCLGLEPPFGEQGRDGSPDGAVCEADDDCRSGRCPRSKLCAPSFCDCPSDDCPAGGEASRDCDDTAVCVYYEDIFESAGEIFNIEHDMNGGYCRPLCDKGCPEHFTCADGRFCTADSDWAAPSPTLTWSGPVAGTLSGRSSMMSVDVQYGLPIKVAGAGTSPVGQAIELQWMIVTSRERSMPPCSNPDQRSPAGTGSVCGYEGSGCCDGCDRQANTCL